MRRPRTYWLLEVRGYWYGGRRWVRWSERESSRTLSTHRRLATRRAVDRALRRVPSGAAWVLEHVVVEKSGWRRSRVWESK